MTKKQEIIDNFRLNPKNYVGDAISLVQDMLDSKKAPTLKLNIDATHSGRLTNNRVYPGAKMRKSVDSFMNPKPRPVLKSHDHDSDPIGRVTAAKFIKVKDGDAFARDFINPSKGMGSGFIQLDLDINDADSIIKFVDGRFAEFSTAQGFDSLTCSICGDDLIGTDEFCGHFPGKTYEIENSLDKRGAPKRYRAYGITGSLAYREVSVVNIAGDDFTGVNSLELIGSDSLKSTSDILLTCYEDDHDIGSIVLANADGETIDLISSPHHSSITASDRKKLTGKVIVAASPLFKNKTEEGDNMPNDDTAADTETKTEDAVETKTTDTKVTSDGDSQPNQDAEDTEPKEDVTVPKVEAPKTDGQANDDLDNTVLAASLKAMTVQIKSVEVERDSKASEVERLKGQIVEKDAELERVKTNATDSLTELKGNLAHQLLDSKLFLCKTDVADVQDAEAYKLKLQEYSERTTDSLKDALSDLSIEIVEFKSKKGITVAKAASETKVENPVSNAPNSEDRSKEKPISREQRIESILD
jgi:hypothetical protein